jgi:hypothetical protein
MRNIKGEKIYHRVEYLLQRPDGSHTRKTFRAPGGKGWDENAIDALSMQVADRVEKMFPAFNFRFVQKHANSFSILCDGIKPQYRPENQPKPHSDNPPMTGGGGLDGIVTDG